MGNDILKMIERCSDTSSLGILKILVGMLFGPAKFLGLKFEIVSIISSFVQDETKSLVLVRWLKIFQKLFIWKWHF